MEASRPHPRGDLGHGAAVRPRVDAARGRARRVVVWEERCRYGAISTSCVTDTVVDPSLYPVSQARVTPLGPALTGIA
jgi:hypothetical protein